MKKQLLNVSLALTFLAQPLASMANDMDGLQEYTSNHSTIEITSIDRLEVAAKEEKELFKSKNFIKKMKNFDRLAKEDKVVVVNVVGAAAITLFGLISWDYGSAEMNFHNEGWFENDTKYGGADKLGHFYSTYVMSDVLGHYYRKWGYSDEKAARLSSLSAWILQGLMEVGDSSSANHGFSYEDMIMNTLGSVASYVLQSNPGLDALIDLRVEYNKNTPVGDIFTDYGNMTYLAALKLNGIDAFKNNFMKYFEVHLGYYTRGFTVHPKRADRSRNVYVGVGLNIPLFLSKAGYNKTSAFTEYIQLPYTSVKTNDRNLND
jgi:hypothetical protein